MSETAGEPAAVPPPTPAFAAWEAFQLNSSGAEGADEEAAWEAAAQAAIAAAPACPCGGLLQRAADALWNCAKAALTVEPTLKQPYPDDPRWSPWTRWVERPAREAHDTAMAIRKHLRETGGQP